MIDWKERYDRLLRLSIISVVIIIIELIVLMISIKPRDEKIWQQRVEIEDLKEQLDRERIRK